MLPAVRAIAGALVLAVAALVATQLSRVAQASDRFVMFPSAVTEEIPPRALPADVTDAIIADLAHSPGLSLFDDRFAEKLRAQLRDASPWVLDVTRIERIFPNRARVDLLLRTPLVSIESRDTRLVLDAECRVLRIEPLVGRLSFDAPVLRIKGLTGPIEPGPDQTLAHLPDVRAAVLVAEEFRALPEHEKAQLFAIQPVALDVSRERNGERVEDGQVWIETANGVRVFWGRAQEWRDKNDSARGLTEVHPLLKVRNLARVLQVYPGLVGLEEVKLELDRPFFRPYGGARVPLLESDPRLRGASK